MKIVILKSSPHKDGASNTLAGFFTKGAKKPDIRSASLMWRE